MRSPLNITASLTEAREALRMIFILRCFALAGQAGAVLGAMFLLGVKLHWPPMAIAWTMLALANIYTFWRLRTAPSRRPISQRELAAQLSIDVAALTLQLMFSDGLSNPFVLFYCLVVSVAAVLLEGSGAIMITVLGLLGLLFNAMFAVPMEWPAGLDVAFWQRLGVLVALVLCLAMVTGFLIELSEAVRARATKLASTRESLLRRERVIALGALAAGAAHELGTPLQTMSLLVEELRSRLTRAADREDVELLGAQLARCKSILARLTDTAGGAMKSATADPVEVNAWAEQVVTDYQLLFPARRIGVEAAAGKALIAAEPLFTQALVTILDNARALARAHIEVRLSLHRDTVVIAVHDDGPGFSAEALSHFAEPLVSERVGGRGLGLFLASTALESLGGQLLARNHAAGGAVVSMILPLASSGALQR
ncbi:MAG TPA: ATP-binding protein [Burkholderiaceae bacterium]|nr:ATP-binding protein [Burkholderiaceae bacterium]